MIEPRVTAGPDGRATLVLDGVFYAAADVPADAPCGAGLRLTMTPPGRPSLSAFIQVNAAPLTLRAPTRYVVNRTWSLQPRMKAAMNGLPGICNGLSVFTSGTFPIGAYEDGDGDLAFAVRSGPLGTDCSASSSPFLLPDGFRLVALDWRVAGSDSTCCVGDGCLPRSAPPTTTIVVPGSIPSEDVARYERVSADTSPVDPRGVPAGANPGGKIRRLFNSMHARLACREADSNDHGVRVTLESVTFEGPANVAFP